MLTWAYFPCGVMPIPNPILDILLGVGVRPIEFLLLAMGNYNFLGIIRLVIQGQEMALI